ncbi:MAG: OmpA family protein [Geobacteraceae bacterium]|nr:OmpA family protein [Geobacteraceae bacterium]
MLIKQIWIVLIAMLVSGTALAAVGTGLMVRVAKPGAKVTIDRVIKDGRILASVENAKKKPLLGLSTADFSVTQSGRTAKVTSVQPIAESQDVPRHIVLVLDNSYSMEERHAVDSLLAGVSELLKIVRPVDDVQIVVFDNKNTVNMGGRNLHVRTYKSNQPDELKAFTAKAYSDGITSKTFLHEGMYAGLEIIKNMPSTEPRFMVVFSDGQDLNSGFKSEVVSKASRGIKGFNAYAIDYMQGSSTDKFLTAFTRQNRGETWKATSETNLVPIFQKVASKMEHYYVVNYLFLPTGTFSVAPTGLTIDEVRSMGAISPSLRISTSELTLRPVVDAESGIVRWKAVVTNARGVVAELAAEGAPAPELKIPLPTTDLQALAAGGDLAVRMELEDRNGQRLQLTAAPVKITLVQTRAGLSVVPASLTIEEIKTIDSSPMLGHIYFAKAAGEIQPRYVRFSGPGDTAGFDEQTFSGTLEKYYQDLNIVGKRLTARPAATITLVGCNDNTGKEKGNKKLSARRAEAVRDYLQTVWSVAPERMTIQVRNLPEKPSSTRLKQGQEENRRVEIISTDPAILAPIRSTYLTTRIDASTLTVRPDVVAPNGIAGWKLTAANSAGSLAGLSGKGSPGKEISIPLVTGDLKALAAAGDITVKMELQDSRGQSMVLAPDPVKVTFIQTSQRLAQKQELRVQEKYALILFEFDKDTIEAQNREIVTRIVERIKSLPQATVEIVGHTDNIGREAYNLKLSERRAVAIYKLLAAAYGEAPGERIRYSGVGPNSPLFDNLSPEARSFNRTVTITLEYLSTE